MRVEQQPTRIVAMALISGAVDAIAIRKVGRQAVDANMPVVAGTVEARVQRDLSMNLAVARVRQNQPDGSSVAANQYKVDPISGARCSRWKRATSRNDQEPVAKVVLVPGHSFRR
jgi:hypothetical protein